MDPRIIDAPEEKKVPIDENKEDVERKRHHHGHHHHPCKNEDDKLSMDSLPPVYQTNNPTPAESDNGSTLGKDRAQTSDNGWMYGILKAATISLTILVIIATGFVIFLAVDNQAHKSREKNRHVHTELDLVEAVKFLVDITNNCTDGNDQLSSLTLSVDGIQAEQISDHFKDLSVSRMFCIDHCLMPSLFRFASSSSAIVNVTDSYCSDVVYQISDKLRRMIDTLTAGKESLPGPMILDLPPVNNKRGGRTKEIIRDPTTKIPSRVTTLTNEIEKLLADGTNDDGQDAFISLLILIKKALLNNPQVHADELIDWFKSMVNKQNFVEDCIEVEDANQPREVDDMDLKKKRKCYPKKKNSGKTEGGNWRPNPKQKPGMGKNKRGGYEEEGLDTDGFMGLGQGNGRKPPNGRRGLGSGAAGAGMGGKPFRKFLLGIGEDGFEGRNRQGKPNDGMKSTNFTDDMPGKGQRRPGMRPKGKGMGPRFPNGRDGPGSISKDLGAADNIRANGLRNDDEIRSVEGQRKPGNKPKGRGMGFGKPPGAGSKGMARDAPFRKQLFGNKQNGPPAVHDIKGQISAEDQRRPEYHPDGNGVHRVFPASDPVFENEEDGTFYGKQVMEEHGRQGAWVGRNRIVIQKFHQGYTMDSINNTDESDVGDEQTDVDSSSMATEDGN